MNRVTKLTDDDIGQWFTYIPHHAQEDTSEWESGKLKSFNNEHQRAFIVYNANDNWDAGHWLDYTAAATSYSDIVYGRHGK